ncbi:hypothetical protein [Lentilitoribacter sp. Alg239-R112]|uniref:hypothetical protein n=1 Tax=Lentilitoribacter sp. Alg239-R112 TaxID=2305987 RepID=UPI0013A6F05E|nr:hypothetical protein [Lentilitoribacter sp. Alg239-R112]
MTPYSKEIEKLERLKDARRSGSLTIRSLTDLQEQIRNDELQAELNGTKPVYRVPAGINRRVN